MLFKMSLIYNVVLHISVIIATLFYDTNGAAISSSSEEVVSNEFTESLREFLKLVETHHLNVTVIRSNQEYFSNGNLKTSSGIAIQLPTNNIIVTEATLTPDNTKDFAKKVSELSEKVSLAADFRTVKVTDGQSDKKPTILKQTDGLKNIKSLNYDVLLHVKDGEKGFSLEDYPNHAIIYNYIITGEEGKPTKNVKVITDNVEIKVLKKSDDFKDEDVEAIKKIVPEYFWTTDDDHLMVKRIGEHLDEKLNAGCKNYQVMTGVSEDFWLSTNHFVLLDVAGSNLLIYCFPKK